jgi:GNAT superfamily N-acetyltransferase
MIRAATAKDLPDIVLLGEEFHEMAKLPIPYHAPSTESFIRGMLSVDHAGVFVIDRDGSVVGMAGVILAPVFFNAGEKAASEMFWFVGKDYRGHPDSKALFEKLEEWAKEKGAAMLTMAALSSNPGIGALYERRGFVQTEIHYAKKL